ncbi:Hypothetical protein Tpal_1886 [Trichococcus palustris]|jgi:hypothetical protein|uniref:Lipoprotein n=1 Tax=Trichococcus palustris TaxID=140314 RepID=A0A143YS35_9LACT|nr:hypothetical protein [Trichococcus palustris]CZQ95398.1 Hypothetical protein Tpal_1886 [Trichococcus palustris]SFK96527.1 hypothetical protein SAMN04488076_11118 [Trichococcus palustris]
MRRKDLSAFLLASSAMLLVACQNPGTDSANSSSAVQESSVSGSSVSKAPASEAAVSSKAVASVVQSGTASSQASKDAVKPSESTASEAAVSVQTAPVTDEAALVERAKQKITELTGYVENENYLFIVEAIEGDTVAINVRENGKDVASSLGFYRYNDATASLQEMDVVTGAYVDFPAQ